jgi:hypothetical protein
VPELTARCCASENFARVWKPFPTLKKHPVSSFSLNSEADSAARVHSQAFAISAIELYSHWSGHNQCSKLSALPAMMRTSGVRVPHIHCRSRANDATMSPHATCSSSGSSPDKLRSTSLKSKSTVALAGHLKRLGHGLRLRGYYDSLRRCGVSLP